jgi:hypothetical protein
LWVVRHGHLSALRLSGGPPGIAVFGFAQDAQGELYVLGSQTGVIAGTTGRVLKLTEVDD